MQRALLSMLNLLLLLTFEPNLLKLSPQFTITKQHSLLMTRNAHHLKNIFHSGDGSNPFSRVQLGELLSAAISSMVMIGALPTVL